MRDSQVRSIFPTSLKTYRTIARVNKSQMKSLFNDRYPDTLRHVNYHTLSKISINVTAFISSSSSCSCLAATFLQIWSNLSVSPYRLTCGYYLSKFNWTLCNVLTFRLAMIALIHWANFEIKFPLEKFTLERINSCLDCYLSLLKNATITQENVNKLNKGLTAVLRCFH